MAVRENAVLAGRYRVVERLGSGGMAVVLLCEDGRLGRRVAVKRMHAESPEGMARRFAREAKLAASLSHPNLVTVFDTVTDEDDVLIVMEYVDGETLADALARGRLEPGRVAEVVNGVAAALDHAHGRGVVHRDVKPANVLLGRDEAVKLTDLGIAVAAEGTRVTSAGTMLGTPAYMAPEQLAGEDPGPPADVYALGAVAFEALSGKKPREGGTPIEIAHRVATEPPPDLRAAWPGAPPAAAAVLERAMDHDPGRRPESAGALARSLEQALAGDARTPEARADPDATVPLEPTRRTVALGSGAPRARRGLVAALLAVAAVALVAALSSSGGDGDGNRADSGEAERAPARERAGGEPPSAGARPDPAAGAAEGARLNDRGYALLRGGDAEAAVPVLRQAVDAFPAGTSDIRYAYALFNLGSALRQAGRPEEAIPVLERRLAIPNQTGTVERELELARAEASGAPVGGSGGAERAERKGKNGKEGKPEKGDD